MIKGVHSMFYSSQAEALRAFLRDKLGLPFTDVGEGWLIFDLPEADMGVHPSDDGQPHSRAGMHDVSFYCDDIGMTVAELKDKGVEFTDEVNDQGYGLVTHFKMPGDVKVQLYQPHYRKKPKEQPAPLAGPMAKAAARKKPRRKAAKAPMKKPAKKKSAKKKAAKKSKRGRNR
jgi:catechol 2,3-dioxygenase-like lactoylglutathione lyase family enzyme